MKRLERLWSTLERLPAWTQTLPHWQQDLGDEFGAVWPLLRPTNENSSTYPCPGPEGHGCPREIVEHLDGEIVAVCGADPRRCDRVVIEKADVTLYELSLRSLADLVGKAIGFRPSLRDERDGRWYLGAYGPPGVPALPVFLLMETHDQDPERALMKLVLDHHRRFVLLTPTKGEATSDGFRELQRTESLWLGLDDFLVVNDQELLGPDPAFRPEILADSLSARLPPTFRLDGDFWTLHFEGETLQLKDSNGMRYLQILLRAEGRELHCTQLEAAERGEKELHAVSEGTERLDQAARTEFRAEAESLKSELEDARSRNDSGRVAHLEQQLELLTSQLLASEGFGGRSRKDQDDRDRLRKRVAAAIDRAMGRIEKKHKSLGRHLRAFVKLGHFVIYEPEKEVGWSMD